MFFIVEEAIQNILDFFKTTVRLLWIYFASIKCQYNLRQYSTLSIKLSNSWLNKLRSGIKSGNEVTLNLSSNVIGSSNDEINFPRKLLLINTQVSRLFNIFVNNSSANINLSKP